MLTSNTTLSFGGDGEISEHSIRLRALPCNGLGDRGDRSFCFLPFITLLGFKSLDLTPIPSFDVEHATQVIVPNSRTSP